ncbi:WD40 repeat-like protein, partial [Rhizopogon salebrosus TDB-379]
HTRAVRALQFDEAKLITGSTDHTIRVWNWRSGECIRTLEGHTDGVVCLNFDSNVLASGSVDTTVKVWNFCTGEAFTLRGHREWVNSVRLWDTGEQASPQVGESMTCGSSGEPKICQGKLLFSASDDGSIRLWDLARRTCVRVSIIRHCLIGQLRCPQSTAAVLTMAYPCCIPVSTEHDDTLRLVLGSQSSPEITQEFPQIAQSYHGMASLDDMEQADQALLRKSIASLAIRNSPRESHTRTQPRHAISPSRPWLRVR